MGGLGNITIELGYTPDAAWAWHNFKRTIEALIVRHGFERVLEVGGGRSPLFTAEDVKKLGLQYTINDLNQRELDLGPDYAAKVCFDIAGSVPGEATYDLVFSQMVLEHVVDARAAYRNILHLLGSGGISVVFYPTLYSPPFVINRLLPERVSSSLVRFFYKERRDGCVTTHPAYYSWCFGSSRLSVMLRELGYRETVVLPFYGHEYFKGFPVLNILDRWLSQAARARDWRLLSSYAYCIALK
jgi:SAM-dependent methyltransferase